MKFRRKFEIKSGIDLTPMIDIVFNLLIFFLLGSTIIESPQIEINLPKSSSAIGKEKNDNITITISKENKIYVNGNEVDDVNVYLMNLAKNEAEKEKAVELRADEDVKTQILISVIDSIKNAGFVKLSIATDSSN